MKISYEDFIFSYEGKRAFRQPPSRPDGRVVGVTYPKCIRKQVYFKIGFTITNLQYTPELAQKTSPEFRRVAEELILALEALYRAIHGQQAVTVISFRPLTHSSREHVLVTLYVGSLGNYDRSSIERVIKEAIINGNVGRYTVSDKNFSIRGFGDRTQTSDLNPKFDSGCRSDSQMICQDGTCIDTIRVCDGVKDCSFGEDDQNCGIATCPPGQFQCDGSRCVDERRRCDSRPDCADRSDEADCEKPKACQPDEFRCGDGQCIKEFLKCDRRYDCQDGSDELSCAGVVCPPGTFRCDNGSCIDLFLRCDGRGDCPDRSGADERGCPCSPSQWQCDFGQCLDRSKLCDGTVDCPDDNSDERDCGIPGCTPDKFRCSDGTCIPAENKCNGRRECRDGSDERNC
ncbi:low-density lipoprotein receptor-related protein 1B, partial [Trichonephila clavata]